MKVKDEDKGIEFKLETKDYKTFKLTIKSPDKLEADQFLRLMAEWVAEEAQSLADDNGIMPQGSLKSGKDIH
jgi:hypothetical protein